MLPVSNPYPMQSLSLLASRCLVGLLAPHRHMFPFGINWSVQAALALVAGILILIRPKLLNFIVAGYLIVIGLLGLFHLHW